MKILDAIKSRLGFNAGKRSYASARIGRMNADWIAGRTTANQEISGDIHTLRARSRQLERDNDIVRHWLTILSTNVLGADGIKLQSKPRKDDGSLDVVSADLIEVAWAAWGRAGVCDSSGQLNWRDLQGLILRAAARDGGCLIRLVRGADNAHRFSMQVMDIDALDVDFNTTTHEGRRVSMGVESDEWQRPVAYYITTTDGLNVRRERVSARELVHVFRMERPGQNVGVPWCASAMTSLRMLGAFAEAELVAARVSACKMGFYTRNESGEGFTGEAMPDGALVDSTSPGSFHQLPAGVGVEFFDPQHPNKNYGDFVKSQLRGVAGGLGVSYNALANDLESVSYSSMRQGALGERENFKELQSWFSAHVCAPIFNAWLEMALLSGALKLPATQRERFANADWRGRRWGWVDPLKDAEANIRAVAAGLKSRRQIIAEAGGDIYDTFEEIAEDEKLAKSLGVKFQQDGTETQQDDE